MHYCVIIRLSCVTLLVSTTFENLVVMVTLVTIGQLTLSLSFFFLFFIFIYFIYLFCAALNGAVNLTGEE